MLLLLLQRLWCLLLLLHCWKRLLRVLLQVQCWAQAVLDGWRPRAGGAATGATRQGGGRGVPAVQGNTQCVISQTMACA